MKKILVLFTITAIVSIGCQKRLPIPDPPKATVTYVENGHHWEGWDIINPPTKFDAQVMRILIDDTTNDAAVKLNGKDLTSTGPKTVYAVASFTLGNFTTAKADLLRRGWKICTFADILALGFEHGTPNWNSTYWNIYCLDVPAKINFGTGDQGAVVNLNGNYYNQASNGIYNFGLQFMPMAASSWDARYLVYK